MASKIDEIKGFFCRSINALDLGVTAIKTPTNAPAPNGTYIAVREGYVEQHGRALVAPANEIGDEGGEKFLYVVTLHITEVEGDGSALRAFRNHIQTEKFNAEAEEVGITLWDVTGITQADMQDGDIWVRQSYFEVRVNFQDDLPSEKESAKGASGTVADVEFETSFN